MQHDNIVRLLDVFAEKQQMVIVVSSGERQGWLVGVDVVFWWVEWVGLWRLSIVCGVAMRGIDLLAFHIKEWQLDT